MRISSFKSNDAMNEFSSSTFTSELWKQSIKKTFERQLQSQYDIGKSSVSERIAKLEKLLKTILAYQKSIQEALYQDFRKAPAEVDITEIYAITGELKHTIKHLKSWMKPQYVPSPITQWGTSSYIHFEPKGVVLIISPWNFPFNLTFAPLISAIAAGNCVIIKPSENTPNSASLMKKMIGEVFPDNEVAIFEGNAEVAEYLTKLPFNHIFFTGSPSLGKKVMKAAAENLCSVTLELGGKSPVIVDETADLAKAAKRIAWAKFLNNGQICIAPDYLYIQENVKDEFLKLFKKQVRLFYGNTPEQSADYNRIVNKNHFNRLKRYIDEATSSGAVVELGGEMDESQRFISPTVLSNVSLESSVMQEEIFGPILPVISFQLIGEVLQHIQAHEKPLALYVFSNNQRFVNTIINQTRAGATVVNHNTLHFLNNNLPFGGSNNSGIGKSHGRYGFEEFSNARAILKQWFPFSSGDLLTPPYTDFKQKLINFTIKYF